MVSDIIHMMICNRLDVVPSNLLIEMLSYRPWAHCSYGYVMDCFEGTLCDEEQFLYNLDYIQDGLCQEAGEECLFSDLFKALKLKSTSVPLSFCHKRQKRQYDLDSTLKIYRTIVCSEAHFVKFMSHVFGNAYIGMQKREARYMCCILRNSI